MLDDGVRHEAQRHAGGGQPRAPVAILARREREALVERQRARDLAWHARLHVGANPSSSPSSEASCSVRVMSCDAAAARPGSGSATVVPAAAPPSAHAAASRCAHSGSGTQSSSVKQTTVPCAARAPRLRAAAGPCPAPSTTRVANGSRPPRSEASMVRATTARMASASDRAVVDDDDLELLRGLPRERGQAALERCRPVASRDDDGDGRARHAASPAPSG